MKQKPEKIGQLIKEYREASGITQQELAAKLGLTQPVFISLMENSKSKVPLATLGELIVILKIPQTKVMPILIEMYAEAAAKKIELGMKKRKSKKSA